MTKESAATRLARQTVTALIQTGVKHVVVSPGSRSAPLVYALDSAQRAGLIQTHVRLDERSAGFFALGLSKGMVHGETAPPVHTATGYAPVAVVMTSGTAVANLHPAVLEAHHTGVPLLILSADRPAELRHTGANQTTVQPGIFADACRWVADVPAGETGIEEGAKAIGEAVALAVGETTANPGPVQVNLCFAPPLTPQEDWEVNTATIQKSPAQPPTPNPSNAALVKQSHPEINRVLPKNIAQTVVIAGDGDHPELWQWAEQRGYPILAEPTSALATHPRVIAHAPLVLPHFQTQIRQVIVSGHPTLSRPVTQLLTNSDVPIFALTKTTSYLNLTGTVNPIDAAGLKKSDADNPASEPSQEWWNQWQRAARMAETKLVETLREKPGSDWGVIDPFAAARHIWNQHHEARGEAPVLFLGASNPIRAFDLAAVGMASTRPLTPGVSDIFSNRGLAGIDGTVSTALGVACASGRAVRVVVGDLTFLHDLTGLLTGELEPQICVQIIVFNDGGGAIFRTLEHGEKSRQKTFGRYFSTPQTMNLPALAVGLGLEYIPVETEVELRHLLALPTRGRTLVEVNTKLSDIRDRRRRLEEKISQAIFAL